MADIFQNRYNFLIGLRLCDLEICTLWLRFYEISVELTIFRLQDSATNPGNPPLWTSPWRFGNGSIKLVPFGPITILLVLIVCAKPRLPSTVWQEIDRFGTYWNGMPADEIERKQNHDTSQQLFRCAIHDDNQNYPDFKSRLFWWRMECLASRGQALLVPSKSRWFDSSFLVSSWFSLGLCVLCRNVSQFSLLWVDLYLMQ